MATILDSLGIITFLIWIAILISPSLLIKIVKKDWTNRKARWIATIVAFAVFIFIVLVYPYKKIANENLITARELYQKGDIDSAFHIFMSIDTQYIEQKEKYAKIGGKIFSAKINTFLQDTLIDSARKYIDKANQLGLNDYMKETRLEFFKIEHEFTKKKDLAYLQTLYDIIKQEPYIDFSKINSTSALQLLLASTIYASVNNYYTIYERWKDSSDFKKPLLRAKKALEKYQVTNLPRFRKKYAELKAQELWEHDYKVIAYNYDNNTIKFVNARYASNKYKKEDLLAIRSELLPYRYKYVVFAWIEHDPDPAVFKLIDIPDSRLVKASELEAIATGQ